MPKGGARINSGISPDPNAAARSRKYDTSGSWTTLPSGGFLGKVPTWPLAAIENPDLSKRERTIWNKIWRTPQAYAWDRLGWSMEVALYCRLMAAAEAGQMSAAVETRQWSNILGINPAAMLRNRWKIGSDEVNLRRVPALEPTQLSSVRDRLKSSDDSA